MKEIFVFDHGKMKEIDSCGISVEISQKVSFVAKKRMPQKSFIRKKGGTLSD